MTKVFDARSNWNLEVDFCGGRKTGVHGEKPSKHRREPTNSTHIACWVQESNPGHSGERRALLESHSWGIAVLLVAFHAIETRD